MLVYNRDILTKIINGKWVQIADQNNRLMPLHLSDNKQITSAKESTELQLMGEITKRRSF